ncbi:MAG: Maf family nucleotide pyrophosphatase [Hydrotalea sp.]|nr:Maf family nucleotide pyrophosphatase [Hydrotalea sp.]
MTTKQLDFILASQSPRRVALLAQLSIAPQAIVPAIIDEVPRRDELPKDFVIRMAKAKAQAVATQQPQKNILSADTVVAMGRRILLKPESAEAATAMIKKLQGRRSRIYTAMTLLTRDGVLHNRLSVTKIKLKELNSQEIKNYITRDEWRGRAGGLALDQSAAAWLAWLNGSPTACLGLDLKMTYQLLKGAGLLS